MRATDGVWMVGRDLSDEEMAFIISGGSRISESLWAWGRVSGVSVICKLSLFLPSYLPILAQRTVYSLSLYSTATQNYWRWVLLRHLTQKIVLLRHLTQGYQHVGIFCVR